MPVTSSISDVGSGKIATAQVTVATTAGGTLIAAARPGRNAITVVNEGTTVVRLGTEGVTTATGALLPGVAGASFTLPFQGDLYGIVAAGTQLVSVVETYN